MMENHCGSEFSDYKQSLVDKGLSGHQVLNVSEGDMDGVLLDLHVKDTHKSVLKAQWLEAKASKRSTVVGAEARAVS